MKRRRPKTSDQLVVDIAYRKLKMIMATFPEIEPNFWASACWSVLVDGYIQCGISYEDFCSECENVKNQYKQWFEDEK